MTRRRVVVGVDVGTTSMKAAAFALDGRSVGEASVVTCWDVGSGGETDLDVDCLTSDFTGLVTELVETTGTQPIGIGITGMAETGVVVDDHGAARHRAIAWFNRLLWAAIASLISVFSTLSLFLKHPAVVEPNHCVMRSSHFDRDYLNLLQDHVTI